VAAGRVPLTGGDPLRSWTGPLSLAGGTLAVLTCSFLAATLLAADSQRAGDDALAAAFRRRALGAGAATGVGALLAAVTIGSSAATLAGAAGPGRPPRRGVRRCRALGHGRSVGRALRPGRWGAFAAVGAIRGRLGGGQYPAILVDSADIGAVAGDPAVLTALVVAAGLGALVVFPSMAWLFHLAQRAPTRTRQHTDHEPQAVSGRSPRAGRGGWRARVRGRG